MLERTPFGARRRDLGGDPLNDFDVCLGPLPSEAGSWPHTLSRSSLAFQALSLLLTSPKMKATQDWHRACLILAPVSHTCGVQIHRAQTLMRQQSRVPANFV